MLRRGQMRKGSFILLILLVPAWPHGSEARSRATAGGTCIACHGGAATGFSQSHEFAANNCVACHAGDNASGSEEGAHVGLIAFPGDLENAARTCGLCHADKVASVTDSLMHTGRGIVHTTRAVVDGATGPVDTINLQSLGHGVADSMLRKQCASCHLGQPKTSHALDVTRDRGGGCAACHINEHPADEHPALSADVSDGRCFGCHSRSGRISLSYAGLAEVDESRSRLADGRPVQKLPADVHYLAGMRCTACHDADDVMGSPGEAVHQRDAVDAACTDCHEKHEDEAHHRLTCNACHSQWAPQCYGCHMEYDEDGEQWDHVERQMTPGRWSDKRWNVRNGLPALGVHANGQVDVFVPGMIMTIAHPALDEELFVRRFAPLSPHTTGPSRSCASCHRSTTALGLGRGELRTTDDGLVFEPSAPLLPDGMAGDAWTRLHDNQAPDEQGHRPFDTTEMKGILDAAIVDDRVEGPAED